MKKAKFLAAATMATIIASGNATAIELWEPHLPGLDIGLASGTLPPQGVYGVLNSYWASPGKYNNNAQKTNVKLDALVVVPVVLWSTGLKVFGADYAVAISQPLDYTNLKKPGDSGISNNGHWGAYNTVIAPVLLSWKLPRNLHVKAGLLTLLNNASSSPARPAANGGVGAGNGYATLMPELAISWLEDGWNLSADAYYSFNGKDSATGYRSGQELEVDYTVTKTIGKWGVGVGAFQVTQTTDDTGPLPADCASSACRAHRFGLGPIVSYQFEGINLSAQYARDVHTRNAMGGGILNVRLVVPFQ